MILNHEFIAIESYRSWRWRPAISELNVLLARLDGLAGCARIRRW